jgi:hypothetical protein
MIFNLMMVCGLNTDTISGLALESDKPCVSVIFSFQIGETHTFHCCYCYYPHRYYLSTMLPPASSPLSPNTVLYPDCTLSCHLNLGFPFLCLLEICPSTLTLQAVCTSQSWCNSHFLFHYTLYYGVLHVPKKCKCVINLCYKTMRQIDLTVEYITESTDFLTLIFFQCWIFAAFILYVGYSKA